MNKKTFLKIINAILAIDFIMLAGGGITRLLAPEVIPYDKFRIMHPTFGIIFIACVVFHLILNWTWVRTTYFTKKK
jgi:hypothetical protein